MTDRLGLSVVVPTFDGCEHVLRLLRALEEQTLPRDEFEVVVVVDGSEDGTKEALEAFDPGFRLRSLFQENRGRSAARNAGIAAAAGDVVVFVDDDIEPAAREAESRGRSAVIFAALHPHEDADFDPKDVTPPSVARRLVRYVLPRMSIMLPFLPGLVIRGVSVFERASPRPLSFS